MAPAIAIAPARPEELPDAFGLIFQQLPEDARAGRVANALGLIQSGQLDPAGVLVAHSGADLVGALVCTPVPGAASLVWPPRVRSDPLRTQVEDALFQQASAWLRRRGARLGQALLTAGEATLGPALERNGFPHVTTLWYLRHNLNLRFPFLREPDRLTYVSYQDGDPEHFHQTLLRTYEGTLDCPEVNGVRDAAEILEGHRSQGTYEPRRWWLALDSGQPVGVLLFTEVPDLEAWEVAYVGVVPERRRRGWGRELMHKALRAAHASDAHQLTLSVDGRNRPAWKLYLDLGFEAYDLREVYLAVWNPGPPGAGH